MPESFKEWLSRNPGDFHDSKPFSSHPAFWGGALVAWIEDQLDEQDRKLDEILKK